MVRRLQPRVVNHTAASIACTTVVIPCGMIACLYGSPILLLTMPLLPWPAAAVHAHAWLFACGQIIHPFVHRLHASVFLQFSGIICDQPDAESTHRGRAVQCDIWVHLLS